MTFDRSFPGLDELIARAKRGDEEAFTTVLRAHAPGLEAYVRRHLPPQLVLDVGPDDVVQDTYLEACRRFAQFEAVDSGAVARWLATIARHRIVDLVRRHRTLKRGGGATAVRPGQAGDDDIVPMLQELAVYERTPSQSALSHERRIVLQHALELLPQMYRDAIRMRYFESMSVADIAVRLGRTDRAVHMLCNRALKALRRRLQSVGASAT